MAGNGFPKALKPLIDAAMAAGWTVDWTQGSHIRFRPPKDSPYPMYHMSGTPSDWRSTKNAKAFLKRCGVEVDGNGGRRRR